MTAKDRLKRIENERDFAERSRGLACVHGEYKSRCRMCAEVRNEDALLAARAGMVPAAWKELALALLGDRRRYQARVDAAIAALRRLGEELP